MNDVIDARATATKVRKRHFPEGQARDRAQQLARRGAYFLAMCEMTGILVSNRQRQFAQVRVQVDRGKELVDVFEHRRKLPCPGGVAGVVLEQLAVFLERGARS